MNIALMGYGTVGSGVAEVIRMNHDLIVANSMQDDLVITKILDLRDFPGDVCEKLITHNFEDILNDPSITIVVECMGGLNPAYKFVKSLLEAGKSVVTSNKELVAEKGFELLSLAKEKNVNFLFEASVGGGIPIIRPLSQCLAANEITEIAGILNGTTNYILTEMIATSRPFEEILKEAQALGYAEANPAADVEGTDACRKICILASLSFDRHIYPDEVYTAGITGITLNDVKYASKIGGVIKLVASAKMISDSSISACVMPAVIMKKSQLAGVDDVFNAILVRGNAIGDVMFYGRGAGKLPTASAVVADVIDCAKHVERRRNIGWGAPVADSVADFSSIAQPWLIRAKADNIAESVKETKALFGDEVNIIEENPNDNEFAFVTPCISINEFDKITKDAGFSVESRIRITDY